MTTQAVGSGVIYPPAGEGAFDFVKILKKFFSPQPTADTVVNTAPPAKQIIATVEPFSAEVNDLLGGVTSLVYGHLAGITQFSVFVEAVRPNGTTTEVGRIEIAPSVIDVATEQGLTIVWGSPPIIDVSGDWLGIRILANRTTTGADVLLRPQSNLMILAGG